MPDQQPPDVKPLVIALNLAWQIALPLFVLVLVGRYVDQLTHTAPLFFFVGLILSIAVSSLVVWRMATKILDRN